MPKVLIYISKRLTWIFLFYGSDFNENRAHVHVGKRDTDKYCKLWLEPEIEVGSKGDLTDSQINDIVNIAEKYKDLLLNQWNKFKAGDSIRIITIKA
ncbi:MAG: DUF4160 domain-containing protein [Paludibacteraceae bacterium]|nr:DUF4160 domain-containing protein [Paludibacteraceae bacterium]